MSGGEGVSRGTYGASLEKTANHLSWSALGPAVVPAVGQKAVIQKAAVGLWKCNAQKYLNFFPAVPVWMFRGRPGLQCCNDKKYLDKSLKLCKKL